MGLGAVLAQINPQEERPIVFLSLKLASPELKYAVIEKEVLAMGCVISEFCYYLWEQQFMVVTTDQSQRLTVAGQDERHEPLPDVVVSGLVTFFLLNQLSERQGPC